MEEEVEHGVYHGLWDCQADMEDDFEAPVPEGAEVLFAIYDEHSYEGDAFVLFRHDGGLFEVNGSHCSCYGLEGQWDPEPTSVDALHLILDEGTKFSGGFSAEESNALRAVLDRLS